MNLDLLKRTRMYKGYNQYQMAEGIGLTRQTYNYKENGKSSFNSDELLRITTFLDLSFKEVNEIFFDNLISK
ncbi:helix-turn-helix transcriptional regulator [Romboutsia sp. 13368]|uniref:helix-turn-helix transcriptional regulator n=1 Tax=Romboutsia sp. 13368 TaxID=2708053 RepID=UPI0025E08AF3|nr:helix-turn-helix transcriptional regulator [Romboutsia sp. 13368]